MSAVPAASARPNVATSIAIVGVLFFLIARLRTQRGRRLPGADGVLPVLLLPGPAVVVDPAPHRHEEGPEPEPAGDGRWCRAVRRIRHPALVPGRARRPVRDRQRPGPAADRDQPLHLHPRPDRDRGAAHRADGHLQQDRRHAGAGADRYRGAARHR
ncbi:hypothetical protein G6F58_012947 [Rhizopus delemar]|nr:hypothetical protein G6F58_012947 [Rhizopus delemar]